MKEEKERKREREREREKKREEEMKQRMTPSSSMLQRFFDLVSWVSGLFFTATRKPSSSNQCRKLGLLEQYYSARDVPEVFGFSVSVEVNQVISQDRVRDILMKLVDTFPRLASRWSHSNGEEKS